MTAPAVPATVGAEVSKARDHSMSRQTLFMLFPLLRPDFKLLQGAPLRSSNKFCQSSYIRDPRLARLTEFAGPANLRQRRGQGQSLAQAPWWRFHSWCA